MAITYLTYHQIDKAKWDNCIQLAQNGLIYGRAFYLDAMAEHWHAIVLNDYEAVMPLTWKQKWGIRYIYQPAFVQQMGIFFTTVLSEEQTRSFLEIAFQKFRFVETTLNYGNPVNWLHPLVSTGLRDNFILNLNHDYQQLYENYEASFTKSLRRIRKFGMLYVASLNYQKTIELYKYLYGSRLPFFSINSYSHFESICKKLFREDKLIVRHARSTGNQLLASVILLKDEKRLYNLVSCITTEGRKLEANYFLYDRLLHEFSNTNMIFDFEGSDVDGIATFYKKLNPENQPYPFIKYDNLPAFIRRFKK